METGACEALAYTTSQVVQFSLEQAHFAQFEQTGSSKRYL